MPNFLTVRTADFDFFVPPELIAQSPAPSREASRLLVVHRNSGQFEHAHFPDFLKFLQAGDVVVLNDSRVIRARLRGVNAKTGGQFELLLLEEVGVNDWWVMLRPGNRAREGTKIVLKTLDGLPAQVEATVIGKSEEGHRRVLFKGISNILEETTNLGEVPLPPYIERANHADMGEDSERYQTVFAKTSGSVAAPTAGLHFTERFLEKIRQRGVQVCFVTLHVGLGTFAPVKKEDLSGHTMHEERYELGSETAETIRNAKAAGHRVIAVGTTTLRVLESVATGIEPGKGRTRIFIYPPYNFKVVDALLTNFHLPRSTLVMLASAFASPGKTSGRTKILDAYAEAIQKRYRFFSYGDAMLIL